MAEGGGCENPGFGEGDPLMELTHDRHDDDHDEDTTMPFQPNGALTPALGGQDTPVTTRTNLPTERGTGTAETSFIEGRPSGSRVWNSDSLKIELANQTLTQKYPEYGKDGKFLTLEVSKDKKYLGKVVVVGPRGGKTPLFTSDGQTLNPKLSNEDIKKLGPKRVA